VLREAAIQQFVWFARGLSVVLRLEGGDDDVDHSRGHSGLGPLHGAGASAAGVTPMTMLISFFGFAGRIAGSLLTSALGWASSLLFGRVPRSHQVFLVLMMAGCDRTRARAAILSRLAVTSAHLTMSAEAQELEDRLEGVAMPTGGVGPLPLANARAVFTAIDARLLDLAVPTDEWDILFRLRLQIERDLLAGAEPGMAFVGKERESSGIAAPQRVQV
jgi:hypothetical protein